MRNDVVGRALEAAGAGQQFATIGLLYRVGVEEARLNHALIDCDTHLLCRQNELERRQTHVDKSLRLGDLKLVP